MRDQITTSLGLLRTSTTARRRRMRAFAISVAAQTCGVALLLVIGVTRPDLVQTPLHRAEQAISLNLAPPPPRPKPKPAPVRAQPAVAPKPPEVQLHRIAMLTPPPPPPKPVVHRIAASEPAPVLAPKPVTPLPLEVRTQDLKPPVELNSFVTDAPATQPAKAAEVQTGSFRATGAPLDPKQNHGEAATLGGFDLPQGPGRGNGRGGANGASGVVASGFDSGNADPGAHNGSAAGVRSADFGAPPPAGAASGGATHSAGFETAAPAASHAASTAPVTTPVEIIAKPKPTYTAEARTLHIEGDVVLRVRFQADGQIQIEGVVQGLGHGLDEAAEQVAHAIRFRPATSGGAPIGTEALLRVSFQLADE